MDKNTRICIVGGGPAGTSMAMYLEKHGYNNYVFTADGSENQRR